MDALIQTKANSSMAIPRYAPLLRFLALKNRTGRVGSLDHFSLYRSEGEIKSGVGDGGKGVFLCDY